MACPDIPPCPSGWPVKSFNAAQPIVKLTISRHPCMTLAVAERITCATLAYLHWPAIAELIGSDVDAQALSLAERTFSLLTLEGLQRRLRDCLRRSQASADKPAL